MYRALYRKWRPRDFDEVCGQEQVTEILKYQVAEGRVSHAYLFCGSRGTGKTTCAKILAKAVNCLSPKNGNPCHECDACRAIDAGIAVDITEMDAASNNGVDNVRDMKEEISFTPAQLGWRVYIIDEVHMMSPSAFNALLKTLEEPPARVMFILATTELQKLPATVISRCQRFDFRRISTPTLMDRITWIAGQESIAITEDGARAIARAARGGMRDAISLLELCASAGQTVDAETVNSLLGGGSQAETYAIVEAIADRDYAALYAQIDRTVASGGDLSVFWQSLSDVYREMLIVSVLDTAQSYLDQTDAEFAQTGKLAARFSRSAILYHMQLIEETAQTLARPGVSKRTAVEMTLTRMCDPMLSADVTALVTRVENLEKELARIRSGALPVAPSPVEKAEPTQPPAPAPDPKASPASETSCRPVKGWRDTLTAFEALKPSFSSVLRNARVTVDDKGQICMFLRNGFMESMFQNDEATVRLLISLICEHDGDCRPEAGIRYLSSPPDTDGEPFSF